jgi:hypothetical protein
MPLFCEEQPQTMLQLALAQVNVGSVWLAALLVCAAESSIRAQHR